MRARQTRHKSQIEILGVNIYIMINFYLPRYHIKIAARLFSTNGNGNSDQNQEIFSSDKSNDFKYLKDFKKDHKDFK
ncbi:hypothetical protein GCM10010923_25090 [Blastomonas marina]|nr:hypothetical protein GCM10010923_25090 [Blastomonas marina]GGA53656.1 hypothetical protein GCM10010917_43450 [Paenibacillus physcomitrellae]